MRAREGGGKKSEIFVDIINESPIKGKIHHGIPTDPTTHYTINEVYGEKQQQHHMNTFDLTSLIAFPMFFILCVILYCIAYI